MRSTSSDLAASGDDLGANSARTDDSNPRGTATGATGSTTRTSTTGATSNPARAAAAGSPTRTGGAAATTGGAAATARPSGSMVRPGSSAVRPGTSAVRPGSVAARHGRRERARPYARASFMDRYRTPIFLLAAIAGVAVIAGFVFLSSSQPAYACSTVWTPQPTAAPTAGATQSVGYVQPDMGRDHINFGAKVTYTYCAPASGSHVNRSGAGPITGRLYGPGDNVIPQGWIHNLEHGALVLLYRGDGPGATPDGQAQLKAFYDAFPVGPVCGTPKGQLGPVIARFDQMSTPYQAILWGRVLPLETLDTAQILTFWNQWGERTNPEEQCPGKRSSASPTVTSSAAPSGSIAPSAAPSAAPSQAAPGTSAAPSAS